MTDLQSIISQLEQQKAANDSALAALREVSGETIPRGPGRSRALARKTAPAVQATPDRSHARVWATKLARRMAVLRSLFESGKRQSSYTETAFQVQVKASNEK